MRSGLVVWMLVTVGCAGSTDDVPGVPADPALSLGDGPQVELVRVAASADVSRPVLIGRFEVTRAQYGAFVRATGYDGSDHPSSKHTEPFLADWTDGRWPPGTGDLPVCFVNVHNARAYCAWASGVAGRTVRLPTDAEWELAARGEERREFPWGNAWDPSRCNWGDAVGGERFGAADGFAGPAPVGSFPSGATPAGVCDMAGNIWEWTEEGSVRGGPWCLGPDAMRSIVVGREDTDRCDDKFGFRVVVEIE